MEILTGFSLGAVACRIDDMIAPPADAVSTLSADGWTALSATPDMALGRSLTVHRAGFGMLGNALTLTDTVKITTRLRQPYPSQAIPTADRLALSDFIHVGDVVQGAMNMSLRPAPLPIATWLNRDLEICKASTHTVRLAVAHAHARLGRPVAAVRFRAKDGMTTVEALVSEMASVTYAASGLTVPHYAGVLDFSVFPNGAAITIDAVIYPWVGAAFTISMDADSYPSPNLTTLRVLNDRTGAYGTTYAYVDPVSGTAGGVASATSATAAAAPFLTLLQAAAAIRAFNAAQYGRNYTDGGVIRLTEATHVLSSNMATSGVTLDWPLTIEAADAAKRATTVLTDAGVSTQSSLPTKAVIRNITCRRSGAGSFIAFDNGAANLSYPALMAFENCIFDANGAGAYNGWLYKTGRGYFIGCSQLSDCGQGNITGTINKTIRSIGCNGNFVTTQTGFGALGCRDLGGGIAGLAATAGRVATNGPLWGWNHLTAPSASGRIINHTVETGPRGMAVVGCVLEQTTGETGPAVFLSADGSVTAQQNILFIACTVVGSRTNWLYQDTGTSSVAKSGYMRFVVQDYRNTKTDVFGTNANLTGNWPAAFNVGNRANCARRGANDGTSTPGTGIWLGEIMAAGDVYGSSALPVAANWLNDQSYYGGNAGGGDYTPGAGNALPRIPAGLAPYPLDMKGRAITDDGTALSGALQPG